MRASTAENLPARGTYRGTDRPARSGGYLLRFLAFILLFVLLTLGTRYLLLSLLERLPMLLGGDDPTVPNAETVGESDRRPHRIVVVDAGHGGEDGGTSAADGTVEKDLNLSTALFLADLLRASGVEVILTRETDRLLYDPLSDYRGKKKMLDQRERLRITETAASEHPDAEVLFVSIHMNSYPSEAVRGLQVWYSKNNAASRALAESVRVTNTELLQPDNTKEVKAAGTNIFLLDRLGVPAVLIECGFLSCPAEAELLKEEEYRRKVAFTILTAILNYETPEAVTGEEAR